MITFKHNGGNHLKGLFSFIKRGSFSNIAKLTGPTSYSGRYCFNDSLSAGSLNNLIDSNDFTVWANLNSGEAYFTIDMMKNVFKMSGISFSIPCNYPNYINVEGSLDGRQFYLIKKLTGFNNYETKYFSCESNYIYKYFKVSYTGRLHLTNVEIFGVLNPVDKTYDKRIPINKKFILIIFIFLVS